jgi:hypothetical protein
MEKLIDADTCRKYVLPRLAEAGWDNDPHSFTGQRTMKREQINSLPHSINDNISCTLTLIPAVAFFATAAARRKI